MLARSNHLRFTARQGHRLRELGRTTVLALTLLGFLLSNLALDLSPTSDDENGATAARSCCASRGPATESKAGCCCCSQDKISAGNCCCSRRGATGPAKAPAGPYFSSCHCEGAVGSVWLPTSQPRMTVARVSPRIENLSALSQVPFATIPEFPSPEPLTPPPESFLLG